MSTTREYFDATIQSIVQIFGRSRPGKKRGQSSHLNVQGRAFVEGLEPRQLLSLVIQPYFGPDTFSKDGGSRFDNPQIELIFWGSYWGSTTSAQANEIIQDTENFCNSPSLSETAQYMGGPASNATAYYSGSSVYNSSDPPQGFTSTQLDNTVFEAVNNQGLPDNGNALYEVVTPPGIFPAGDYGYNTKIFDSDFPSHYHYLNVQFIGTGTGSAISDDFYTHVLSHETTESMTDPNTDGYEVNPPAAFTAAFGPESNENQICDYEGNNNYLFHEPNGVQVEAMWSAADQAWVVDNGTTQNLNLTPIWNGNTFTGTYDLVVNGDQLADKNDVISVGKSIGGGVSITLNGETTNFDPAQNGNPGQIANVEIVSGTGQDTINVNATVVPTQIVTDSSPSGPDAIVNVGSFLGGTADIAAPLTIYATGGFDDITVADAPDTTSRTVTLGHSLSFGFDSITGLGAEIDYDYYSTRSLTVETGAGSYASGNPKVDVLATDVPTTVDGIGSPLADIFIVGSGGTTDAIAQPLTLNEMGSLPANITVDDHLDYTLRNVTMGGAGGYTYIDGLAPAEIDVTGRSYLVVNTGFAANNITVDGTAGIVELHGNSSPGNFENIYANDGGSSSIYNLLVDNPTSSEALYVSYASDTASVTATVQNYVGNVPSGDINPFGEIHFSSGGAAGYIEYEYQSTPNVSISFGSGTSVANVEYTGSSTLGFEGGAGNDTFNISPSAQNLSNVTTPVTIVDESGSGNAYVYDDNDTARTTYTLNNVSGIGSVTRAGFGGVNYFGLKSVSLVAGVNADTVDVSNTPYGTTSFINSAGGEMAVNLGLGSTAGIDGPVNINDFGGQCDILVDDSSDTAPRGAILANASTSGFGAITDLTPAETDYNYADTASLEICLGTGANPVDILATGSTPTTFMGGVARGFAVSAGAAATLSDLKVTGENSDGIVNAGSLNIYDCGITGNGSSQNGGGIENIASGTINLEDSLVNGNSSTGDGGGVYNAGVISIGNCTVTDNSAALGDGVFNASGGNLQIYNSILYGDSGVEVYNVSGPSPTVLYSDIQGGGTGAGDKNISPQFTSTFALQGDSQCIDAGYNNYVVGGLTDLAGNTRIVNGTVDMGAFEFQGPFPTPTLVYAQGPATVNVGNPFAQAIAVDIETDNEVDVDDTSTVTLTISSGPVGTFADGLSSITVSAVGGKATFGNNVAFGTAGAYVLRAADSADGATPILSGMFNVIQPGAEPTLVFHVPPSNVVSGTAMSPSVVVYENLNGSLDTADSTSMVTLSIGGNAVDSTTVSQGMAVFNNLVLTNSGTSTLTVSLTASDGFDTPMTSGSITVSPAAGIPTLYFGAQPITPAVGSPLNPTITVTQKNALGNPVADSSFVTLLVSGGTLSGSLTAQVSNLGVATFTGLSPSATGNYTLTAVDGNDNVGTLGFTVAATQLVFTQQPQSFAIMADVPMPTFKVSVEQNGVIINDSSTIRVSVLIPSETAYSGSLNVQAVDGTATFSNYFIGNLMYEDYNIILQATDITNSNIASGESAGFSVTPAPAHTLHVYGGGTTPVGSIISPGFNFQVFDQYNDIITNDTAGVVASIASGPGGTLGGSTSGSINSGVNNLVINNVAGTYVILFTDAADGLTAEGAVTITGGPATHLVFLQQPSTTSTSYPIQPPIEVEAEDAFNNLASAYTGMVTLSILTPSGSQLNGAVTAEAQNGLATFSGISIGQLGTYTLSAVDSITASIAGTSNSFNIVAPVSLYVDQHAAGGNGLSWSTAFNNLQSALNAAVPGDTIDVAQGDYSPGVTPGSNPTDTFQLKDGITIQGGFETGGLNGPNPTAYPTVLDGLGVDYHVVTASGTNSSAVLDGVTITNGNASGAGDADSGFGGGLIADGGSPTILNCILTNNTAVSGGAMYLGNEGAVSGTVENCSFVNNTASTLGGAIYDTSSAPTIVNCLFTGNSAAQAGGAVFDIVSSPTITNCTFSQNNAGQYGGAIDNESSNPIITNCILWNDSANFGGSEISDDQVYGGSSAPVVTYSDIEGAYAGAGNISADPLFVNPGSGNYQLQQTSPAINDGNNNAAGLTGVGLDLAGNLRIIDGVIDMGAYEAQLVAVTWTGMGDGTNWSDAANWSDNLVPTQFDDVTIGSGFGTIQVGAGAYAVHTLTAASAVEITAGTLDLYGSSTFGDGLTIDNGAQLNVVQSDPILLTVTSLNINPGGTLDLADNEMLINFGANADPISTIASDVANGYNGGAWNGPGIISTTARVHTHGLAYGLGYADGKDGVVAGLSSGQIEVKYTLLGDANLDGLVNAADFTILAANFNQNVTGWDQGDFNYDGIVNAADFTDLAANFNQGISLPAAEMTASVAAPAIASTITTVAASNTPTVATASNTKSPLTTTAALTAGSTTPTVATVTTKSTTAATISLKKTKAVSVSKAVINDTAKGKSKTSAATTYAASVVTVPTSGSTATPRNTNNRDAKFLADR
ncbi:MAG: choice-of-anchor Q domain-containing protein [Tepidisphaeraceae bacterium]|jgi:predicted outer membrane repeat protein